jgi:peptidoglycan hydrolase CwlO-like protein
MVKLLTKQENFTMKSRIYSAILWLILIVAGMVLVQAIKNQAKFEQQQVIIQRYEAKIDSLQHEISKLTETIYLKPGDITYTF